VTRRAYSSPYRRYGLIALGGAVAIAAALLVLFDVGWIYPAWIVAASVVTFAAYGFDKRRAQSGGERIPEAVLHAMALAGGFPGGWLGRAIFHHKTREPMFAVVLTIATVLHAGFALWWYVLR
jgi:uncharacterized membrane protein YsdA (DUF1294 family)